MSAAPFAVSLAGERRTREVSGLEFRKEMIGGLAYVRVNLAEKLDRIDRFAYFDEVKVYDTRTAATVASGNVAELGRSAGADGQRWDVAAFGPSQHADDIELPLIYVDRSISDGWRQVNRNNRGAQWSQSTLPSDDSNGSPESVVLNMPEGSTLGSGDSITVRNERLRECGQYLGRVSFSWDSGGPADSDYRLRLWTSADPSAVTDGSSSWSANLDPSGGSASLVVTTDFTNGRNVADLIMDRQSGSGKPADDSKWFGVYDWTLRARLMDQDGSNITAGASYGNDYILAHEVVKDLLGRCLPEFDGAAAEVSTAGTHQFDSLAYPDGTTARQVLDDVMAAEPALRWYVDDEDRFRWAAKPTTVRYVATMDDGGDFPSTIMDVYNVAVVRWRDKRGRVRSTLRTAADAGVDDLHLGPLGRTRQKIIDVGDEVGSTASAQRVADKFLEERAAPRNAGTLTVARRIQDLQTGRMVDPHEIQPGELIRVRGVESYADALNASGGDGQTVFRIFALTYSSDSTSAQLELDSYPFSEFGAIMRLFRKRNRKR